MTTLIHPAAAPTGGLKLYQISAELAAIDADLDANGGELTADLEARLDALTLAETAKVDGVCGFVRSEIATADALEVEAARLRDRAATHRNKAKELKRYLMEHLERTGQTKIKAERFTARLQASPPSVAWNGREEDMPPEYMRITVALDKAKAIAAFKAGKDLPYGFVVNEGVFHLRID